MSHLEAAESPISWKGDRFGSAGSPPGGELNDPLSVNIDEKNIQCRETDCRDGEEIDSPGDIEMVPPFDYAQGVATRTAAKMVTSLLVFLIGSCTCESCPHMESHNPHVVSLLLQ